MDPALAAGARPGSPELSRGEAGPGRESTGQLGGLPGADRRAAARTRGARPEARPAEARAGQPDATPKAMAATRADKPPRDASAAEDQLVPVAASAPPPKPVAPTVVQAPPGATTRLISKPAAPPEHQPGGLPQDRGDAGVRRQEDAVAADRRPEQFHAVGGGLGLAAVRDCAPRRLPDPPPPALPGAWRRSSTKACCCSACS